MKKLIASLSLIVLGATAFAQSAPPPPPKAPKAMGEPFEQGRLYLGIGTGLANTPTGYFGLRFDGKVSDKVMLGVGAGVSSWGGRISFTGSYITRRNWCPMISFSRSAGTSGDSIQVELELQDKTTRKVGMKFEPVNALSMGVEKNWYTARGNRFFFDLGYCFRMTTGTIYRTADSTVELSDASDRVLDFLAPGGLVIGFGYSLRLD